MQVPPYVLGSPHTHVSTRKAANNYLTVMASLESVMEEQIQTKDQALNP
jgi:hypothetical protein